MLRLREVMLDDGLMHRLMQLFAVDNQEIQVSVLWAIKNLLAKSNFTTKTVATKQLQLSHIAEYVLVICIISFWNNDRLTNDADPEIQEQALTTLRNLTADEVGVNLAFDAMDDEGLANCLSAGLDSAHKMDIREVRPPSMIHSTTNPFTDNLCPRQHYQWLSLPARSHIHTPAHSRRDASLSGRCPSRDTGSLIGCILSLLQMNQRRKRDLIEANFISTLGHLCERGSAVGSSTYGVTGLGTSTGSSGASMRTAMGSMSMSPGGMRHPLHHHYYHHSPHRHPICPEDDKEAAVLARQVLDLMKPSTVGELL